MIPTSGGPPKSGAAIYRFEAPAIPSPLRPGATEVGPERGTPAAPATSAGSLVLAGLAPSSALRAKWQVARKGRETAIAGGRSKTGTAQSHGTQEPDADDWLNFGAPVRLSHRHSSSGNDASRQAAGKDLAPLPNGFLQSERDAGVSPSTHMAGRALAMPGLCDAHLAAHGMRSMPEFLREMMQSLVMDFMRDLADKVESRRTGEKKPLRGVDVIQPVRESCDEFLRLMRPLYHRYVPSPSLYDDARDVLCAAGPLLQQEMRQRGDSEGELARVMTTTVFPLMPVLLMGCKPRPGFGDGVDAGDVVDQETAT